MPAVLMSKLFRVSIDAWNATRSAHTSALVTVALASAASLGTGTMLPRGAVDAGA